jgi:uncharacterized protein YeaO (DUF488 family)
MATHRASIRVKRVYDPPEDADGVRVLVDRLWPRGLRKENAALTLWLKEIAPSPALRQWFGHDPARWQEFSRRYRTELAANEPAVDRMRDLLTHGRVTLLYAAHDPLHNHALVLAGYLRDQGKRPSRARAPAASRSAAGRKRERSIRPDVKAVERGKSGRALR